MQSNGFRTLKISGWRQFEFVEIDLHPRLTIITGANGAGKSTILSFLNRHFGYQKPYLATPHRKKGMNTFFYGLFQSIRSRTPTISEQSTEIGQITYSSGVTSKIRLPRNTSLHYLVEVDQQQPVYGIHIDSHRPPNIYRQVNDFPALPPSIDGIGNNLNAEYINYYCSGNVQYGSLHHIKAMLIQMNIFGYGNRTMEPIPELITLLDGFEEKLKVLLPKSLGFQKLKIRSPEVLLSTDSGDFILDSASGGIIKLFEVAWQIYFYSQGKSDFVITFDEPENHLHPSMQKSFLPNIMEAFPNAQIIAVTHSPFIISAMQDSSVYVLRYKQAFFLGNDSDSGDDETILGLMGSKVYAQKLDTVNKAGTASEILRDVLGLTSTIPDWAETRVMAIVQKYKKNEINDATFKELYSDLEKEGLVSSYPVALSDLTRSI